MARRAGVGGHDGTVARRFARPSNFGGGLDPVVDGLFMGALCIGLAMGGAFPLWLAFVVIARYLLPALGGGVLMAMGQRPELRHTLTGQVSTTLILFLVGGVCLLRGLHQDASGLQSLYALQANDDGIGFLTISIARFHCRSTLV